MAENRLAAALERFAAATRGADEAALDRPWAWGAYGDEGVRFAFLRTYEELRELATRIAHERQAQGRAPSAAQRILAQYHSAYRDLWAAVDGLGDEEAAVAPAPDEWPVRTAVAHMIEADAGFLVVISHALERHRAGDPDPPAPGEAVYDEILGSEESHRRQMALPLSSLRAWHAELHGRILAEFAAIADGELQLGSRYWEPEPMSLRFRLHRLESHLRQHTVQVDKTQAAIGRAPDETRRLLRLLHAGLAEVEGALLGAADVLAAEQGRVADAIAARADEIAAILA